MQQARSVAWGSCLQSPLHMMQRPVGFVSTNQASSNNNDACASHPSASLQLMAHSASALLLSTASCVLSHACAAW